MNLKHLRENGISYYSIGALFKSSTKTNTERLSRDTIKKYKSCNDIPMCIIGGLNKNNIDSVIEYQPDMIAISNGIFGQEKDKIQDSIKMFQEKMNAKS